jgi:CRP-like cAMP-binding protein
MDSGTLGKVYKDKEIIVHQNEIGDCMYVIQAGQVEIIQKRHDNEVRLAILSEGDFFGEMAIFEKEVRSATVRAKGDVTALTIDKKNFLRRIHEDPSLAYHIVQTLSNRIRKLNTKHTRVTADDRRDWENRPEEFEGK